MTRKAILALLPCFPLGLPQPLRAEEPDGPLARYVAKTDDSYAWTKRREGRLGAARFAELTLTSQTWRGAPWQHQLFVLKPRNVDNAHQALLLIAGGRWNDRLAGPFDPARDELPREARLLAGVAETIKSPIAVLLHVPHQPIEGRVEDDLIAHTFVEFIKTGDEETPLLLPMAKSAVRAMDAVQEFSRQAWQLQVERFTVTGASKRGWTTWLSGAVDRRVTAIAPMVIDVLNMPAQMEHQLAAWNKYSEQIEDYTRRGIQAQIDTPAGRRLNAIVDPYSYRRVLKQPKLLLIGTNDRYWPLDALNLYWDDLVGPKHVLYVPNNGHDLNDIPRVVGGVVALHRAAAGEIQLPKLDWRLTETEDELRLQFSSDAEPRRVQAWLATSPTRDFRQASWRPVEAERKDGHWRHTLPRPTSGYAAMFGEAEFADEAMPYFLSTNVKIIGER